MSSMEQHIERVYAAMEERAIGEIYEGSTAQLLRELCIPASYSHKIMVYLTNGGYVEQVKRGGGMSPSRHRLIEKPNLDDYEHVSRSTGANKTKSSVALAKVSEMATELLKMKDRITQLTIHMNVMQSKIIEMSETIDRMNNGIDD